MLGPERRIQVVLQSDARPSSTYVSFSHEGHDTMDDAK
jgi:hypothetical protein